MDSAACCFTRQYVMGMFSCHRKFPFALTAAASHCVAGGRVTQPVPTVTHPCHCLVSTAPTDGLAFVLKPLPRRKVGRDTFGGLPLALNKTAQPLNPLFYGDVQPTLWGLLREAAQWQGVGLVSPEGKCLRLTSPCGRGASPWPELRKLSGLGLELCSGSGQALESHSRSRGQGGQNRAVKGAIRVEISPPIDSRG